jgi:integrase
MARPPTGSIVERPGKKGITYALRFRALDRRWYVTLDVRTHQEAELELENVLAEIRRGIWRPPAKPFVVEVREEPTFHEYASEWLARREQEGLRPKTIGDLRWSLELHVLPFFAEHTLSAITPREVKRYLQAKLAEREEVPERRKAWQARKAAAKARSLHFREPAPRPMSNASINHTVRHLGQILEEAVDDELLATNPATGSRRRLKAAKPARPWVEPEQLPALLDAASGTGQTLLEILAGGGLRIGEALALRWQHVELGTGTIHVRDSKTAKGVREVHLSPALRECLTLAKADATGGSDAFVIATSTGRKHNPSNLRRDVLAPAVATANETLEKAGISPIGRVTFHSLRRTYASLRCACGDDVRYTADQLGHEDPRFTLRVYAQATKRRDRLSGDHLKAYDRALQWAQMGTNEALKVPVAEEADGLRA